MHVAPHTRPRIPIPAAWYQPSDGYGIWRVSWLFVALFALIGLLPVLAGRGWYWACLLLAPLIGAYAYKLTIVMHDCCHRTLFRTRSLNHAVGVLCGGVLGSGFGSYCTIHWAHHRHCGTDDDAGDNDYLVLDGASPTRLFLHLARPLTGLTFFDTVRETLRTSASPADDVGGTGGRGDALIQLLVIVFVQLLIAVVASGAGAYPWLVCVYPVSAATFGLFFSRTRAFCEHVSYGRTSGECFVRSHEPNWFDRLFFYTLNMNLHVEHHWFPQVPAERLPDVRRALLEGGHLEPQMTSRSIAGTVLQRFRDARAWTARA